jgi:hypothetical protein
MTMEKYAYGVIGGYVTISGTNHPVSSFTLILTHNGIPELRLTIDPVHTGMGNVASDPTGDATPAVLSNLITKYDELQQLVSQQSGREVSFKFKMVSADGDTQELVLRNWLLVAVGYGGISASGAVQMSLNIQHPVRKLSEGNIHLFANHADKAWGTELLANSSDVLDGIKRTLTAYANITPVADTPQFFTELRERTNDLVAALTAHTQWEGHGWPDAPFNELKTYVPHALQAYITNIQGRTPWSWLMQDVLSDWYLSMRNTYWQSKLTFGPYAPWEKPSMSITDADVSDFTLPASDPRPLAGVVNLTDSALLSAYTVMAWRPGMSQVCSDGQAHTEPNLPGAIDHLRLPEWVPALMQLYRNANGGNALPGARTNTVLNAPGSYGTLGPVPASMLTEVRTAMKVFCKQMFCHNYRQMTQVQLQCRLMLRSSGGIDGKYITPGYVCSFDADPEAAAEAGLYDGAQSGTLFKFFVTQVVHTVDCNNATASTDVYGQYLRRDAGPQLGAIPGTAPNYLYEPAGVEE